MLPFEPETVEAMRARFPAAVATLYEFAKMVDGAQPQPGGLREHVFDFPDGLRLIVSRDDVLVHGEMVHLSASAAPGTSLHDGVGLGMIGRARFAEIAEARYREISGDGAPMRLVGFSPGSGCPHWFREESPRAEPV